MKLHPDQDVRLTYRIKSPAVWMRIRTEWEAGRNFAELARAFDVSESTVRARCHREGWLRTQAAERLTASAPIPLTALDIAECALARALEALSQGRAGDAMALIKAGDSIGAFADFVAGLRAARPDGATPSAPDRPAT